MKRVPDHLLLVSRDALARVRDRDRDLTSDASHVIREKEVRDR